MINKPNKNLMKSLESHTIEFGKFTLTIKIDSEFIKVKDDSGYSMRGVVHEQEITIEQDRYVEIEKLSYKFVLQHGKDILEGVFTNEEYHTMLSFMNKVVKQERNTLGYL